jgi:hypothetical protein
MTSVGNTIGGTANTMTKQVGNASKTGIMIGGKITKVSKQVGGRVSKLGNSLVSHPAKSPVQREPPSASSLLNISETATIDAVSNVRAPLTDLEEDSIRSHGGSGLEDIQDQFASATDTTPSLAGVLVNPQSRPACVMIDEGDLCPPAIYSRVELENESHPFFKRVWTLRHTLNMSSPLLDNNAHMILQNFSTNGGEGWPPELNSYEKLREHVKFEDISITLTGTDHVTGNAVYANTSYNSFDLVVGYQFANMLVKSEATNAVGVDLSLLNDVLEQHGGGAEPLFEEEKLDPPLTLVNVTMDIEKQFPESNIHESEIDHDDEN